MADPLPLRAVVGPAVRRIREGASARQEDVAAVAHEYGLAWDRATVGHIEAGRVPIGVETVALLVAILTRVGGRAVTVADLLDPATPIAVSPAVAMTGQALADVLAGRKPSGDQVTRTGEPSPQRGPVPLDRHVAQALGVTPDAVVALAHRMSDGRTFTEMRDSLAREIDPHARGDRLRGLRGRCTSLLITRMRQELAQAALAAAPTDTREQTWP